MAKPGQFHAKCNYRAEKLKDRLVLPGGALHN